MFFSSKFAFDKQQQQPLSEIFLCLKAFKVFEMSLSLSLFLLLLCFVFQEEIGKTNQSSTHSLTTRIKTLTTINCLFREKIFANGLFVREPKGQN